MRPFTFAVGLGKQWRKWRAEKHVEQQEKKQEQEQDEKVVGGEMRANENEMKRG